MACRLAYNNGEAFHFILLSFFDLKIKEIILPSLVALRIEQCRIAGRDRFDKIQGDWQTHDTNVSRNRRPARLVDGRSNTILRRFKSKDDDSEHLRERFEAERTPRSLTFRSDDGDKDERARATFWGMKWDDCSASDDGEEVQ